MPLSRPPADAWKLLILPLLSWLHLTALPVFLLWIFMDAPDVRRSPDALAKILFQWVQVVQDLIIIEAPARPIHIHSISKDNTKT